MHDYSATSIICYSPIRFRDCHGRLHNVQVYYQDETLILIGTISK